MGGRILRSLSQAKHNDLMCCKNRTIFKLNPVKVISNTIKTAEKLNEYYRVFSQLVGKNLSLVLLFASIFCGFDASTGICSDIQKGINAYKEGDYSEAYRLWNKLAENGNPKAQLMIGNMYYTGKGVTQNDKLSTKWFKRSAEQGNKRAQTNLGTMYFRGRGTAQDFTKAYMWLEIAVIRRDKVAEKNRRLVAKEMNQIQIDAAKNLAKECIKKKFKGC